LGGFREQKEEEKGKVKEEREWKEEREGKRERGKRRKREREGKEEREWKVKKFPLPPPLFPFILHFILGPFAYRLIPRFNLTFLPRQVSPITQRQSVYLLATLLTTLLLGK
jgi:hypothetical protein